ncbi:polyphosphate kinase 1 [Mucilaginibacter sp. PAMB04274]|uniref:polyphosphate kinase 1 n=1 Tax=Mucilaginibacter sp. PAMB04274 TaxID=3138568 RepID=UPI0031F5F7A7
MHPKFFNRDVSWLSFNERVLQEAERKSLPLLERINFLSIYSSNLDEFYRVRMPVLSALNRLHSRNKETGGVNVQADDLLKAQQLIQKNQEQYGQILTQSILPELKAQGVNLLYKEEFPPQIARQIADYFLSQVMAFLQPVTLTAGGSFFPENNKLYFLIELGNEGGGQERIVALNIPSDELPRFYSLTVQGAYYIVLLDDIIRYNLDKIFSEEIKGCHSFKITRDAEFDFEDEYTGDLADQLERQLRKRDYGFATRFLHEPGLSLRVIQNVSSILNLNESSIVEGGRYHNLKDLASLPVSNPALKAEKWPALRFDALSETQSLLDMMGMKDYVLHPPYHSYDTILRFFNEAAIRPDVEEIYVSLYRVASDSKIVNALISAAKNGKKVNVMVELKARFDEANNIKWAKKLKAAGARLIYSVTALKVHAKIALVKLRSGERMQYRGLLATGNFNENTARFYTDHILLTGNRDLLREMELLFIFLSKRKKPAEVSIRPFKHLLVAQFNLQERFMQLIDREIENHKQGLPSSIIIKMNNLEEEKLINKLYEASNAGVKVQLIVRSICRLVPGVPGQSENITVTRIVDRYLEHGRIFIFGNNGSTEVFMGSSDWMNRNIYHRIEVCFPVYNADVKQEIMQLIDLQLQDNTQAVYIDTQLNNIPVMHNEPAVRSQQQIYALLQKKAQSV